MKVYLLTFTSFSELVTREEIQDFLGQQSGVVNWFGIMPNAILYASNLNSKTIAGVLVNRFGNDLTFLITRAKRNQTTGFINKEVWDFINSPRNNLQTLSDSE